MKPLDALDVPLEGVQLIEASAGTGKTFTITTLVLRLLLERRLGIHQILVVTFTNAATAELRQRVRNRLLQAIAALDGEQAADADLARLVQRSRDCASDRRLLVQAARDLDEAAIFTIHGACQRALSEHAFESGVRFDLELVGDVRPMIVEAVRDFWATELYGAGECELAFLQQRGRTLSSFEHLAQQSVGRPDLVVVPEPRPSNHAPAVQRYLTAKRRARMVWESCRGAVRELLLSTDTLDRNRYRATSIPKWCDSIEEWLAAEPNTLAGHPACLKKLAPSAIASGTRAGRRALSHAFFECCAEVVEAHGAAVAELEQWLLALEHRLVHWVRRELAGRKLARGVQSFDDLLQQLASALSAPHGRRLAQKLAERYPAALIDEFQDTDPTQYRIFRTIYERGTLLLIGDPKQAIYAFRGADIFAYLEAARDARDARYTLAINRRSDPTLIAALNAIFSGVSEPFVFPEIEYVPVAPAPDARDRLSPGKQRSALEIVFVERAGRVGKNGAGKQRISKRWATAHLPRLIARQIAELLHGEERIDARTLVPGDIAVLTRTNREARAVQEELRALRVPSVLHGDSSVLDSTEAEEVGYVMRAMADPTSRRAVRAALATSWFGLDAPALFALTDDEQAWERWVEKFQRWHATWLSRGFVQAFRTLLYDEQISGRLLTLIGGERRLTNVLHLSELLHQASCDEHLGVVGLLRWYDEIRFDETARQVMAAEAMQIRLESDDAAVQLTTMHRSKGLEYPVVFCPYLWDGTLLRGYDERFPRYHDASGRLVLDLCPDDDARERARRESRAEALRLAYVALTRARHRVVTFWGAFKTYEDASLGYLLHRRRSAQPTAYSALHEADDAALHHDLHAIAAESAGAIAINLLRDDPLPPYSSPPREVPKTVVRSPSRVLNLLWRSSSFSALTKSHDRLSAAAQQGLDRDEEPRPTEGEAASALPPALVPLHEFPRGAKPGEALHRIFELHDFTSRDRGALERLVVSVLDKHGIEQSWCGAVADAVEAVLATPLRDDERRFTLGDIAGSGRLNELEFMFPVASGSGDGAAVTPGALAKLFAAESSPALAGYDRGLAQLGFAPLAGFLRGFVDLIFERDGRFYIVDYKSNYLGPTPGDYSAERLWHAMAEHHYVLQYHLYAVALHRHLSSRLPGYDYARHFGGIYYLFVRGMSPSSEVLGVYRDLPRRELVVGLSRALGGT